MLATIAEFESRQIAGEVMKGLTQKAKTGGWPTRAPLGYLNVREQIDGYEVRTVAVDPDRAPLVQWAWEAYGTGDWTLNWIRDALEEKGLRTVPTARFPAKALHLSHVEKMFKNIFYSGIVRYKDVEVPGRHEPLITPALFERVQEVLRQHNTAGERTQRHHHYLKGSVFCGLCVSRLVFTKARGRHGGLYDYFFCQNRQKNQACSMKYVSVAEVEKMIENYYETIAFTPDRTEALRGEIRAFLTKEKTRREKEAARQGRRLARLTGESTKLLHLAYKNAIPDEVFAEEQARIKREISEATRLLEAVQGSVALVSATIDQACDLAEDCAATYKQSPPALRRQWNQVLYKAIWVLPTGVRAELASPFAELFDLDTRKQAAAEKVVAEAEAVVNRYSELFWERRTPNPGPISLGRGSNYALLVALIGRLSNRPGQDTSMMSRLHRQVYASKKPRH